MYFFFIEHIYIHVVWQTESSAGMIPRAVDQVFRAAGEMKAAGSGLIRCRQAVI